MIEEFNEKLFKEWWIGRKGSNVFLGGMGFILRNSPDSLPIPSSPEFEFLKAFGKFAFLAGRQTMMPQYIEEASDELELEDQIPYGI